MSAKKSRALWRMASRSTASAPGNLLLASHLEGVQPDLVALAKGLTGGYMPMSITITTQKIYDAFYADYREGKAFMHSHTYSGNPLGCSAALAVLKVLDEEQIIPRAREKAPLFRRMIVEADSFRGFFDILPHAFRDPELRERMFSLYVWWYQQNLKWLGLGDNKAVMDSDMLMGLAELIAAIPDGLSVQAGLNPDGFDLSRPLATLEFLLRRFPPAARCHS